MGIVAKIRASVTSILQIIRSRAGSAFRSLRKSPFPFSDRMLTDALRLAEIPSPTKHEEQRAAFILERLNAMGLSPRVDEDDNILVRLSCQKSKHSSPIMLFADISSPRWHPLESLSRLDSTRAYGAGLADALAVAALLSVAESMLTGLVSCTRDILLLFAVHPLDNPANKLFERLLETSQDYPYTALGIRGIPLGTILTRSLGTYRLEVRVRTDGDRMEHEERPSSSIDTIVSLARTLSGVTWDSENKTRCRIRRIEAGTGFGRNPTEGILDIELESSDSNVLDLAMKAAVATAEAHGKESKVQTTATIVGFVPVGDTKVSAGLVKLVSQALKDHKIRMVEGNGADPAAYLSSMGVPALSIALASGREGLSQDEIDISSIEKGRKLLVSIVERLAVESI